MGYTEREAFLPIYPSQNNVAIDVKYGEIFPGVTVETAVWTDEGIARMQKVLSNSQEIRDLEFGSIQGDGYKYEYGLAQHPFVNPSSYDTLLKSALDKNKDVPQQLGITPDKYTQSNWWIWLIMFAIIAYVLGGK